MPNHPPNTTVGVNWRKPLDTPTKAMIPALLTALALIAALIAPAATTAAPVDAVGTLAPNMVEMLDGENSDSTPMSLNSLRRDVFRGWHGLEAGTGVDVAVIDTGVAPVDGLDGDYVLHGPDLSFEASTPEVAYLDTYGHGTHMAGIIAGRRVGHEGVAPGARIVSLKVAGHDGITTVPQVVAAIDWVIDHRDTDNLNIRVLNLSLGQAGVTNHQGDLLSAAVERAWDAGIFVVVAAGNSGDTQSQLDSPAIDPYVMAVGAVDPYSDRDRDERTVPNWSGHGDGTRNPDIVAPGRSILSYRVPGSTIDTLMPSARYNDDLFRGSGTSQAAAVMSGFAAAVIAEYPHLTNDQVKDTITYQAMQMAGFSATRAGDGHLDGPDPFAHGVRTSAGPQNHTRAAGNGTGIAAPTGSTWSGGTWSGSTWSGTTWSGGTWSRSTYRPTRSCRSTWSGGTWSGSTWSGGTWSGGTWSGGTWSGATWSGNGWN